MRNFWLVCVIVLSLLSACGGQQPTERADPLLAQPTAPVLPISPVAPPLTPELDIPKEEAVVDTLQGQVAEKVGVKVAELTLVSEEAIDWPDASLGCPQPDMMYAQVVTPGWRMVFADATGRQYAVHTTANRQNFVVCEPPAEFALPPSYRDKPAVAAAIKTLVEQTGVTAESVSVLEVTGVEWSNSCLGCVTPGQRCLMVITPGYRILLQSGADTYNLHTDRTGRQVIICPQSDVAPPRSDS